MSARRLADSEAESDADSCDYDVDIGWDNEEINWTELPIVETLSEDGTFHPLLDSIADIYLDTEPDLSALVRLLGEQKILVDAQILVEVGRGRQTLKSMDDILRNLTPFHFVKVLYQLTPCPEYQHRLLELLTRPLDPDLNMIRTFMSDDQFLRMYLYPRAAGDQDPGKPLQLIDFKEELPFPTMRISSRIFNYLSQFISPSGNRQFVVQYSTAIKLFDSYDIKSQCFLIKALSEAGPDATVFGTVAGRALGEQAWHEVEARYFLQRTLELGFLYFLGMVGWAVRNGLQPNGVTYGALIFFASWTFWWAVFRSITILSLYGISHGWRKAVAGKNMMTLAVEFLSAYMVAVMLWHIDIGAPCLDEPGASNCWIRHSPLYLAVIVFLRWIRFLFSLFATTFFGEQLLPAYKAMFSAESLKFLFFIMMCVYAAFSAYYMFPIPENMPQATQAGTPGHTELFDLWGFENGWEHIMRTFMKMYRLNIMGDFDLWELEGLDPVLSVTKDMNISGWKKGESVADIDDPPIQGEVFYGIRLVFVCSSLLINVMLMNVYIGLLSTLYDGFQRQKKQLLAEYRSSVTWDLMLEQLFVKVCTRARSKPYEGTDRIYFGFIEDAFIARATKETDITEAVEEICKRCAPPAPGPALATYGAAVRR